MTKKQPSAPSNSSDRMYLTSAGARELVKDLVFIAVLNPPRNPEDGEMIRKVDLRSLAAETERIVGAPEAVFGGSSRLAFAGRAVERRLLLEESAANVSKTSIVSTKLILDEAVPAAVEAVADFAETTDVGGANLLTAIGAAVSRAVRRAILVSVLESVGWNLTVAARLLRIDSPATVLRALRDLELQREYAAAKKSGVVRRGGARPGSGRPRKV